MIDIKTIMRHYEITVEGIWYVLVCQFRFIFFCLLEVRAMVVAVQQPSAECTAIFTVCIV